MKKLFYISMLFFVSCSLQEIQEISLPLVDEKKVQVDVISELVPLGIHKPGGLLKSGMECVVFDRMNANYVYRVDLETFQAEGLFPRVRTRSGKTTLLNSLASDGHGGWTIFDFNTGELKCCDAGQTRSIGKTGGVLPTSPKSLWAVQAGNYTLSTGLYTEGRYMLYSPTEGCARYFIDYPEHPECPDLKEYTKSVLYASNVLKVRSDGGAFVCADMYSGIMDICRLDKGEIKLVNRLVFHYPHVKIREKKKWPSVVYSQDNRLGFTDVCVTETGIYALYSGQTYRIEGESFQHCRILMEIDWEGNVCGCHPLDMALTQIAYDEQERALYGIGWCPKPVLVRLRVNDTMKINKY